MAVETLRDYTTTLSECPAFVSDPDGLPQQCARSLRLIATTSLIGDDYGSWSVHSVSFECGHTTDDMQAGLRNADYI